MLCAARGAKLFSIDHFWPLLMSDRRRCGLAVIIGRRRGNRLALRLSTEQLLADRRILPALETLNGILSAAETQFHCVGLLPRQVYGALQSALGLDVEFEQSV